MYPITSSTQLGQVLRKYRKDIPLTQKEAGQRFNIAQSSISDIENGRTGVRLDTLFRYIASLNLEMHLDLRNTNNDSNGLW